MFTLKNFVFVLIIFSSTALFPSAGYNQPSVISDMHTFSDQAPDVQSQTKSVQCDDIRVVVVKGRGNCFLDNASGKECVVNAKLTATGKVWGWKGNDTPPLQIFANKHADTLIISTTPFNKVWSVGVSTYSENLDLHVSIPLNVKIIFAQSEADISAQLQKKHIGSLQAKAKDVVEVQGAESNDSDNDEKSYSYIGEGAQNFIVRGHTIHLKLR